jgi:hypothetical protein
MGSPFDGMRKIDAARRWLSQYLADGQPRPASDVLTAGLAAGHAKRTLQLAAHQVCTIAPMYHGAGASGVKGWHWQLSPASQHRLRLPTKTK